MATDAAKMSKAAKAKATLEDFKAKVLQATEQAEKDKIAALWPAQVVDPDADYRRRFNSPTTWSRI